MSSKDEEDDRIEQEISALDRCDVCGCPIRDGQCAGCIDPASLVDVDVDDWYERQSD